MEQEYAGAARSTDSRRGRLWDAAAIALLVVIPPFFLKVLPGGRPPYGGDVFVHVYPLFSLIAHGLHAGRPTLWNPYAAGGYPIAPYGALAVYPPVVVALLLLPVAGAIASLYAAYLAVLGVGTYLLAGDLGQSRPARLLAAITMACGGFVAANVYAGPGSASCTGQGQGRLDLPDGSLSIGHCYPSPIGRSPLRNSLTTVG